jgi:hypothetical protein
MRQRWLATIVLTQILQANELGDIASEKECADTTLDMLRELNAKKGLGKKNSCTP